MSSVHLLSDSGSMRVTVEHGQWDSGLDEDMVADLVEEIRFHSLDEESSGYRSSWSGFDEALATKESRHGGRRSHQAAVNLQRPMSPGRLNVMSDVTRRHRSSSGGRRFSASALKERSISDGLVGHGPPVNTTRLIRLSRDATQPNSGSMSDLRGEGRDDDEETDVLPALSAIPVSRPRAFTCPDIKAMQRKTKVKLLHRPPTPTPGDESAAVGMTSSHLESPCVLSSSGEIFVHDEEDELPVISET